ncbi:MAG: protoporphyrinogen/coproporphyrinogen oxidase [Gemmatimonadota bacterium]
MPPHVVILGAGPAGLGAAFQLRRLERATVTVVEQQSVVGGNAGSFEWQRQRLDYGSHRLHPATDPAILADIRELLGADLLDRPRHGRIRLRGKWIHFPLEPADLLLRLDRAFARGVLRDAAAKALRRGTSEGDTFASVLLANLGPTICRDFYFPYARKIWGREPEELSGIQARRRVSAGSFGKMVRKVLSSVPGLKPTGAGRFFYPRWGFGQISEAYAAAATQAGADLRLDSRVLGLVPPAGPRDQWMVEVERHGNTEPLWADHVWSTIPVTILARVMRGEVPDAVRAASHAIDYRAMLLVYLQLGVQRFTEFDAHYFPGADVRITRLSEPKNYAATEEPPGRTVVCAELPCSPEDPCWSMSEAELGQLVMEDLARSGLDVPGQPLAVTVRRLRNAYPIYVKGYEEPFGTLDRWADSLPRLLSYGRQGLFAHDNTHHALYMAYCAAECLGPDGTFDEDRWQGYRKVFATHVVED